MTFEQHVFLSDVHLGAFSDEINQKVESDLIQLIRYCSDRQYPMYILGDLFDYWMEFPKHKFIQSLGNNVLDEFEKFNSTVKPILYITGNHDNWTFGHFKERGFLVEANYHELKINDTKMLLMHGDGVASNEMKFPRALSHRILRDPWFVKLYQHLLGPKYGIALMKWFSSQSRKKNIKDPRPLNRQAERILRQWDVDYILCGHDHLPRVETFSGGTYINTGAFFKHQSIAVYNNEHFDLVTWLAKSKNFVPFEE